LGPSHPESNIASSSAILDDAGGTGVQLSYNNLILVLTSLSLPSIGTRITRSTSPLSIIKAGYSGVPKTFKQQSGFNPLHGSNIIPI
jgi:hypothetical protein